MMVRLVCQEVPGGPGSQYDQNMTPEYHAIMLPGKLDLIKRGSQNVSYLDLVDLDVRMLDSSDLMMLGPCSNLFILGFW